MKIYNEDLILGIQESCTIFLSALLKFIDIIHPEGFHGGQFRFSNILSNSHNLFSFNFGSDGKFVIFAIPIILLMSFPA